MSITRLQGIFPVFKPRGITSSQLLEVIKIKLNKGNIWVICFAMIFCFYVILLENTSDTPVKMGHGGTLDINATGVLGMLAFFNFLVIFLHLNILLSS